MEAISQVIIVVTGLSNSNHPPTEKMFIGQSPPPTGASEENTLE
jgi:hypothetical protein